MQDNKVVNVDYMQIMIALTPYVYGRFNIDDKDENIIWLTETIQNVGYDVTYNDKEELFCIQKH
ncbi:MAG: hypothetical protein PHT07_10390 [Paludibacter sp.]|nr:hypothetical protein [Paludibacter sp.]